MELEMKTLRVSDETHKELAKLGTYGDTMEDIIRKLLDYYQRGAKK